jgi:hypothetical protein
MIFCKIFCVKDLQNCAWLEEDSLVNKMLSPRFIYFGSIKGIHTFKIPTNPTLFGVARASYHPIFCTCDLIYGSGESVGIEVKPGYGVLRCGGQPYEIVGGGTVLGEAGQSSSLLPGYTVCVEMTERRLVADSVI